MRRLDHFLRLFAVTEPELGVFEFTHVLQLVQRLGIVEYALGHAGRIAFEIFLHPDGILPRSILTG